MSEEVSEKTPDSGGPRAIEAAGPKDGALARPTAPPVVFRPEAVNPFWSERFQDEAALRALRPADLPSQEPSELLPDPVVSPPRDGSDVRVLIQGLFV